MQVLRLIIVSAGLTLSIQTGAQWRWMLGGGYFSPPTSRIETGSIGLQTKADRVWSFGLTRIGKNRNRIAWGVEGNLILRSLFYELDQALPYYPWKPHLPTYRFESIRVMPFLSYSNSLFKRIKGLDWEARVSPVFVFHEGNALSTTTAYSVRDRSSFILYRLGLDRHPMGIPFLATRLGLSYSVRVGSRWQIGLQPYGQWHWRDRSRVWYQSTPMDPIHASSGYLKNDAWSFGLQFRFERRS